MNAFIVAIALMGPTAKDQVCPIVSGRCDTGCKCFEGKPCICAVAKKLPARKPIYVVVIVGKSYQNAYLFHSPKAADKYIKGLNCETSRSYTVFGFDDAKPKKKVRVVRRQPVYYRQPQFFSGGCANGQCGRR